MKILKLLSSWMKITLIVHPFEVFLLMTKNWQQIDTKSKSHKSYKVTDRSVPWMDGLSIAHGSYVDERPHWLWDTAQHSPHNNFSCKPSSHTSPQAIPGNPWPPLVTTGYLFLHGAFPIWFGTCSVAFTDESSSQNISTWNIRCRNIWRIFQEKKMAQIRQILNYQSLKMTSRR